MENAEEDQEAGDLVAFHGSCGVDWVLQGVQNDKHDDCTLQENSEGSFCQLPPAKQVPFIALLHEMRILDHHIVLIIPLKQVEHQRRQAQQPHFQQVVTQHRHQNHIGT